jgi:DNA-directed RNA polymerase specialized sigma24 family protein
MSAPDKTNHLFSVPSLLHESLKQKDIAAFEYLYDRYSTPLYTLIISMLPDTVSANMILEKAFRLIWEKIGLYDTSRCTIFTWMCRIAREEAILEKQQLESGKQIRPGHHENFNNLADLRQLISQIPEPFRSTLLLSYFENASDLEISTTMNIDISSVKENRNKALVIMNKLITGRDEIKKPSLISERVLAF